ncbi:SRPBCC family protein [Yinghuangia soli]|uniref:SRPBCC family protein n=1 Tax=Yinghuangia soli TaxID=2908204 RepID=A0AA41U482_9ACTN|nr:SRPBCC family protein [Yinghuangia soli]MCF2532605.1 SRPBCC family protein [Yinghuangia soli]
MTTSVPAPPAQVFAAALDAGAHSRSMARHGERVVGGPADGVLRPGDEVTFEARHFGLRWRLTARITGYDEPRSFVDEQVRGPFRTWRHEHRFEDDGAGGTVMVDDIEFRSPVPGLGRLVDRLFLRAYMERVIRSRGAYLRDGHPFG